MKVAGLADRRDAETCLGALEAKGIPAELRDDHTGACELWVRASDEPQARLIMGLSGRSVIRLSRGTADRPGKRRRR